MTTTRNTQFCLWLQHLGSAFLGDAEEDTTETMDEEVEGEIDDTDKY
jgi:hypothetical protein